MNILTKEQIIENLDIDSAIAQIEMGFVAYSKGESSVPPVGHLPFAVGDCHIKYGHIASDPYFVIKIATGFNTNRAKGLPSCNGMMIIMDASTGFPVALLQDEGLLTDIRTAIGGLIAGKYLGPKRVEKIGIIGCGGQAKFQLEYLTHITDCRRVMVWNHNPDSINRFKREVERFGFRVEEAMDVAAVARECNLIITTTPSTTPLIKPEWVREGTHITAVGADAPGKQELDEKLVELADIRAVDSYSQCTDHGEVAQAYARKLVNRDDLIELGEIVAAGVKARTDEQQITLADLTGVAVQDIKKALSVYESYTKSSK